MAAEPSTPLTAHRNSDDNKWYYRIHQPEAGPAVGPFHSVEEAIEASKRFLPANETDAI